MFVIFIPPTSKLKGRIGFGLCMILCVHLSHFSMHAISNEPCMLGF